MVPAEKSGSVTFTIDQVSVQKLIAVTSIAVIILIAMRRMQE